MTSRGACLVAWVVEVCTIDVCYALKGDILRHDFCVR